MNPLADLRDIQLPAEPGLWPPAPGWWLLALVMLALTVWSARRLHARWRLRQRRQRLLGELGRLLAAADDPVARLQAASQLLRRAARRDHPQALLLRDEAWLRFLDGSLAGQPFSRGAGRLLLDGPFRPQLAAEEVEPVLQLVRLRLRSDW